MKRDISGRRRGPGLERRHTVADSSTTFVEKSVNRIPTIPETPESTTVPKMSGSEKKKILLGIVRDELNKNGMTRADAGYKDCIRKLHDMCRTLVKVLKHCIIKNDSIRCVF